MILHEAERNCVGAVAQREEGKFFAGEAFFNEDAPTGLTEAPALDRVGHGGESARGVIAYDHAFAERKPIGLYDQRNIAISYVSVRRIGIVEDFEFGGRHPCLAHDRLRKGFAGFELRSGLRRAEEAKAAALEFVGDSGGKRILGTDDGEIDSLGSGEVSESGDIGGRDIDRFGDLIYSGATARAEEASYDRALIEPPAERMLASAFSDYEDLHQEGL
jgi:hypothetical protein